MTITSNTSNFQNYFSTQHQDKSSKSQKSDAVKSFEDLSLSEKELVSKLQARDTEVKAHEAAHKAAGGGLAGSASYSYEKGPDGKIYAVGGEVPIAFQEGQTPQETITNARQVKAAALAPTNPSSQDYAVASSATVMELKAQQELLKEMQAQLRGEKAYK